MSMMHAVQQMGKILMQLNNMLTFSCSSAKTQLCESSLRYRQGKPHLLQKHSSHVRKVSGSLERLIRLLETSCPD
ncbi:Hypothetical predicted protein [Lynx pardinus]|uniref:Uncharacterized protein n=1 Tax=Lynx pardinus TaxID=191816 RepID=A0A485PL31_LYNPA|nr:Hypothetical predicted protein [Lynx pardinus]